MSNDFLSYSNTPSNRLKTRPTFVLIEPVDLKNVMDVPSLACAILLGACSSEDIDPVLIPGQTRIHDYLFSKGLPEVWALMERLDENAIKELNSPIAISEILERGYSTFEIEMTGLYQDIILDKHTRIYIGGGRLERFFSAAETIGGVYHYYLTHRQTESLSLVDLYVDEILDADPCLIGFSIFSSFDPLTRAIRKKIKSRSDTPIIVGGGSPAISARPAICKVGETGVYRLSVCRQGGTPLAFADQLHIEWEVRSGYPRSFSSHG